MTTRILLQIDTLTVAGGTAGRKLVTCGKTAGGNYATGNFKTETGAGLTMATGNGTGANDQLRTCDEGGNAHANDTAITVINKIQFDLPEKLADQLVRYFKFKEKVKRAKDAGWGATMIDIRNLTYDDTTAPTTVAGTYAPSERFILKGTDTIVLKENSFSATITDLAGIRNNLWFANPDNNKGLNAADYASNGSPSVTDNVTVKDAFKEELEAFEETEKLIDDIESDLNNWKGGTALSDDIQTKYIDKLTIYLGGIEGREYKFDEGGNIDHFPGGIKTVTTILDAERAAHPENVVILAKKALLDLNLGVVLTGVTTSTYYKEKILGTVFGTDTNYGWGGYYQLLNELKIWKECGFNTIDEIAQANANGYVIFNRGSDAVIANPNTMIGDTTHRGKIVGKKLDGSDDADAATNIAAIKTQLGTIKTYQGFDVTKAGAKEAAVSTDVGKRHLVLLETQYKEGKNTKTNVDRLRAIKILAAAKTANGENDTADRLAFFNNFGDLTKTDPKQLWGYEPGDVDAAGNIVGGGGGHSLIIWDDMATKKENAIRDAGNKADAIKEAFIDTEFDEVEYSYIPKADLTKIMANHETAKVSKSSEMVDRYYMFLRSNTNSSWSDNGKTGNDFGPKDNDPDTKKIEDLYKGIKKLVEIIEYTYKSTDKAKAEIDKPILESWITPQSGTIQEELKDTKLQGKFTDKLTELSSAITGSPDSTGLSAKNVTELDKLITEATKGSNKEKAYSAFKAETDNTKKTDKVFDALKLLIAELEKISHDKPKDLEKNFKPADTTDNKRIAWEFVNNNVKIGTEGWADKVSKDAVKILTDEIALAEAEMKDEGDAKAKTTIASVESVAEAKAIKELFIQCKRAHNNPNPTDSVDIKTKLSEIQGGSVAEKAAWEKVNKYTKSGESEGYATASFKIVDKNNEDAKKSWDDLYKIKDPKKIWADYKADQAGKQEIKLAEEDVKRLMAVVALENGDATDQALAKALNKKTLSDYKEDKTSVAQSLTNIENDIKLIQKYIDAKDTDKEGITRAKLTALNDEFGQGKKFLEDWVAKLTGRKETLEKVKKTSDSSNDKKDPVTEKPFFKTPLGYATIAVIVLAVVGAIAYFIKSNSSEEGEGE